MLESVTMERTKLIEIVKRNRDNHLAAFTEAMEEYRLRYRARLIALLGLTEGPDKTGCKFEDVNMRQPRSHCADYDRALSMLDHSVDGDIPVDERTFRQLVLDEWEWRHDFESTNALYAKEKF
jgi:hypothetical protein